MMFATRKQAGNFIDRLFHRYGNEIEVKWNGLEIVEIYDNEIVS